MALLSLAAVFLAACTSSEPSAPPAPAGPAIDAISYDDYDRLLAEHVDDAGLVDYAGLQGNRAHLDAFVADLGRVDPGAFDSWDRAERLAFWINAYNAITLVRIIDHYPIDRGGLIRAVLYPANSIRQIDGVWTKLQTPVLGRNLTLDQIEHDILRKDFDEPRIHAAIVCAAKSCPPLRAEAFRPNRLDDQLEDQGRRFLGVPHRFRIDREKNVVYLSPILEWFAEDFVAAYGSLGQIGDHSRDDSAALHYARRYVSEDDAHYIDTATYRVSYLDYDWSLNEQP